MTETNVFELTQPGTFSDPLTEVLRYGARTLLGQAVEAEVAAWLSTHTDNLTDDGRRRLVRHGHLPEPIETFARYDQGSRLHPRTARDVHARAEVGHWGAKKIIICKRTRPVLVLHEGKSRVTLAARLTGKRWGSWPTGE